MREYLNEVLKVTSDSSLRQLKRARDRQAQACQSDYLSEDRAVFQRAKAHLDQIHLAFDCLSSQRKFRDYLNRCNDRILLGEATAEDFLQLRIIENEATEKPEKSKDENVNENNVLPGPTPGIPTPVPVEEAVPPIRSTTSDTNVISLNQEKEHLNARRKKHAEDDFKKTKQKSARIESLKKKTIKLIEDTAQQTAAKYARELRGEEIADPDEFYEKLYKASKKATDRIKEEQLAKMRRMDLPVNHNLLDDFATISQEAAEEATQKEFFSKHEGGPLKPRKNSPVYLVFTALSGIAVFLFFINFAATMWVKLPDPVNLQKRSANGSIEKAQVKNRVDPKLTLSPQSNLAEARNLAAPSGPAGMAGYANSLEIPGAADYNRGLDLSYERKYDLALKQFDNSLRRNPFLFQTPYNEASLYYWQGREDEALEKFKEALSLRPDLAQACYNRGVINLHKADQTIAALAKPKNADSSSKDAEKEVATRLLHAAIEDFELAMERAPLLPQPIYNRGQARLRLGDLEGAREDFASVLKLNSTMTAAKHNLARVESELARKTGAVGGTDPEKADGTTIPAGPEGPQGPPGPGYL